MSDASAVLRATPLFADLDDASLSQLAAQTTRRVLSRGQYLCYEGDVGDRLFILVSGLVKVFLTSESGGEVVLATLGPHESLGELAVLDGQPRSASVIAMNRCEVLMLARPVLVAAMREHPPVLDAMMKALGALVRRQTELTGDLAFLDLGGRVAKVLIRLAEQHGTGGPVLDLHLSQQDLADMVAATRPAVNRTLQTFAVRGLISVEGQVIVLRDLAALRRRAAG